MGKPKINLDKIVAQVNEAGDGIWDIKVEIEEREGGQIIVWLIDRNEEIASSNFYEDWISKTVFEPLTAAVKEQSGDPDFYFEPESYAGRFLGAFWY